MKFGYLENVDGIEFSLPEDDPRTAKLLSQLKSVAKPEIYIGCPVWGDDGYVGEMYPLGTKPKDYLTEYCKQFNCIEVNATRYGVPSLTSQKSWKGKAGEGFKFSFKMPQVITHRKDINDRQAQMKTDQFLQCLDFFGDKAGMTFMLMSPYFKISQFGEMERYINNYPVDLPLAIEVRDSDFYQSKDVYQLLSERSIPLCVTDAPGRRDIVHSVLTSDTLFVRFVGAVLHQSDYTRIDQWVDKIVGWVEQGLKTVYFFMHQPAPYKYKSGPLSAYMVEKLNARIPNLDLKAPIDYSKS